MFLYYLNRKSSKCPSKSHATGSTGSIVYKGIQPLCIPAHNLHLQKQPENEGQRTVPHEVTAPMNGKSMEDWCNFEQSPKHGSPNFDVSADAVSDGDILDSETVYK